jgi:hypothetical protein
MVKWLRALWQMAKEMASGPAPEPVPQKVVKLADKAKRRRTARKGTQAE